MPWSASGLAEAELAEADTRDGAQLAARPGIEAQRSAWVPAPNCASMLSRKASNSSGSSELRTGSSIRSTCFGCSRRLWMQWAPTTTEQGSAELMTRPIPVARSLPRARSTLSPCGANDVAWAGAASGEAVA